MSIDAHPAHLSSLPAILRAVPAGAINPTLPLDCPGTAWAAEVGRSAADVAALLFRLPMPEVLQEVFEEEIRATVAHVMRSTMEHVGSSGEAVERHCQDVAWIAFDRRLERLERLPYGGEA